jgi:hypothetical protein
LVHGSFKQNEGKESKVASTKRVSKGAEGDRPPDSLVDQLTDRPVRVRRLPVGLGLSKRGVCPRRSEARKPGHKLLWKDWERGDGCASARQVLRVGGVNTGFLQLRDP